MLREKTENDYRDHHVTTEAFLEAVRQECFICTRVWSYTRNQYQVDWKKEPQAWNPLTYNLRAESKTQKLIRLSIRWTTPHLNFTAPVAFYMSPVSGACFFFNNYNRTRVLWLRSASFGNITYIPSLYGHLNSDFLVGAAQTNNLPFAGTNTDTSSALSLGQAYQWYMSCRARHKQCSRLVRTPRWCPTRLLDIGQHDESIWKLRITSQDICTPPQYMTLSYCWGSTSSLKLTQSNIDACRRGSLINDLPQTFRDIITVLLGDFRFIKFG
jgi:hypothetical protein